MTFDTDSERLLVLAAAIEKYGFPHGLSDFPTGPAVDLLRRASERLQEDEP